MHLKRWLTGIIALPILIYLIGFGPREIFCSMLYLVSLAGLMEFYRMTAPGLSKFVRWSSYFLALLMFLVIYMRQALLEPAVIAFWAFVPMTFFIFNPPSSNRQKTSEISKAVLGPVYVCLPLAMLSHIHQYYPEGKIWVFFLLVVIFASDTGAFYCGKLFGKHKLYEAISPGKTWEGAIGGLLCSIIAALWFLHILRLHQIDLTVLALVLALSITGQIGDLAESMLKRNHGVKDSGKILPGHGGILDRIDGLLFSIPILYIFLVMVHRGKIF
ncbi:MAG: phosphatidate cytidylyltransferase [Deltaproteobacteria bacterium]|nr:phosphatidate cytidylyltransferase [Deltaproteobacteria bacterium]